MDKSPHKSCFMNVNGIQLHYLDWGGDGPALLFLAGMGCNAHIFDSIAPRFTDKFHALALTRRGHGQSDYPEAGYDIDTLTDDIFQFLDCTHIDRVILVGHSMAGIELTHFAALYPERVRKLVYLDAAYDRTSTECKEMNVKWPEITVDYPDESGVYENFDDVAAHITRSSPSFAAVWGDAMHENWRNQMRFSPDGKLIYKGIESINQAINATLNGYTPEYTKIHAPVLNIYAIKDNTYFTSPLMTKEQQTQLMEFYDTVQLPWNRHCIEQFQRDVPHARIVEIEHAHHYPFLKDEERVCNEMKMFLLDC